MNFTASRKLQAAGNTSGGGNATCKASIKITAEDSGGVHSIVDTSFTGPINPSAGTPTEGPTTSIIGIIGVANSGSSWTNTSKIYVFSRSEASGGGTGQSSYWTAGATSGSSLLTLDTP
jgi:hypothetical protein